MRRPRAGSAWCALLVVPLVACWSVPVRDEGETVRYEDRPLRRAPGSIMNNSSGRAVTLDHGAPVRGGTARKRIALIFTGGEHGEGSEHILDVLQRLDVKASFFVTGDYIRRPEHGVYLRRMLAEGHYLGPHSDSHPLYCPWEDRERTLVTEEFFREDLHRNMEDLRALGALRPGEPVYFIPPYEWFNRDQVEWAGRMGVTLFNFTPGSGSNRDWAPEGHKSFAPARAIVDDILGYERKDPHGLNGFLLLLHLGAQREDKVWRLLEPLLIELRDRGYGFARVDVMIEACRGNGSPPEARLSPKRD